MVELSKEWELEKSNPSYTTNDAEYFIDKEVWVALFHEKIIGYALGEIKNLKEETSYNKVGEKAFELDELFILKEYRDRKIGRNLFIYLEASIKDEVDLIGVIATTYKYNELLKFYIEDLKLDFNYALLVKRM